jgi:hypothetical protein
MPPLPPGFCDLCFQYFARKVLKTFELNNDIKALLSSPYRISPQNIDINGDTRKILQENGLAVLQALVA